MEKLKRLITDNEFSIIVDKKTLSKDDVFKLSSYTPYTLVEKIGDLRNYELNEVYLLEANNIVRVLNTVAMLFGVFSNSRELVTRLFKTQDVRDLLQNINSTIDAEIKQGVIFKILALYILSGLDIQNRLKPIFEGKIPKKTFSFRQMSAEAWFENYVEFLLSVATNILNRMDANHTFLYVIYNTAWYLNRSQTFKYYQKSTDKDLEDTLFRIIIEFMQSMDVDSSYIKNTATTTLFKDL